MTPETEAALDRCPKCGERSVQVNSSLATAAHFCQTSTTGERYWNFFDGRVDRIEERPFNGLMLRRYP